MPGEILYVKLNELDTRLGRLHSRIELSETACPKQLQGEIVALRKECAVNELALRRKLRYSRAGAVAGISDAYTEIGEIVKRVKAGNGAAGPEDDIWKNPAGITAEEQILLAEYALDFAVQAADQALLIALEAIAAQITETEDERRKNE